MTRLGTSVFVATLLLCGLVGSVAQAQTVLVPMRDGVTLSTQLWNVTTAKRNVVLHQTPYGKGAAASTHTMNVLLEDRDVFKNWGFVYVVQDMRGTGANPRTDADRFMADHQDTADTIEWIKKQSWFGGKIMTYGVSATGTAATLAIQNAPPELVCNVAWLATGDVYGSFYPGGAWRKSLNDKWLTDNAGPSIPGTWKAEELRSEFWDDGVVSDAEITNSHVLTYYVAGQFDIFRDAPGLFHRLKTLSAKPDAHYLLLGPWTHSDQGILGIQQGDVVLPFESAYFPGRKQDPGKDMEKVVRHCLGTWGAPSLPKVRYYTMELTDVGASTGYWTNTTDWPPPGVVATKRFLSGTGLAATAPATAQTRVAPVDPANPIGSLGGGELVAPAGPRIQGAIESKAGVLTFTSPAATVRTVVAGDLSAEIWAASDTSDIDVIVRVSEILKDGRVVLLTDGVRRGRFVGGYDAIVPLTPGLPAKFQVDLGSISFRLPVGHKLRVSIQGTSTPRYDLNPNEAVPLSSAYGAVTTALTLYAGAEFPSAVTFPVLSGTLPDSNAPPPPPKPPSSGGSVPTCQTGGAPAPMPVLWLAIVAGGLIAWRLRGARSAPRGKS